MRLRPISPSLALDGAPATSLMMSSKLIWAGDLSFSSRRSTPAVFSTRSVLRSGLGRRVTFVGRQDCALYVFVDRCFLRREETCSMFSPASPTPGRRRLEAGAESHRGDEDRLQRLGRRGSRTMFGMSSSPRVSGAFEAVDADHVRPGKPLTHSGVVGCQCQRTA